MAKRFEERLAFERGKVGGTDEAPIIEGVLLCGPTSANKRRYKREAFAGDRVQRYNGVPVFLNHGKGPDGRPYQEQIGLVQNARHREDGMPIGDIAVNPEKPCARAFVWDAKHQPKACGMSHVVHAESSRAADGWEDVTEMVRAESVDVISAGSAATTKGLYEGKSVGQISLKAFVERFGPKWGPEKWGRAKKLCEDLDGMGGGMADMATVDEPPADATEGDLKSALMQALTPFLEEAFDSGNSEKLCAACKDFVKMHAKHTGKGGGDDEGGEKDKDKKKPDAEESKKADPFAVLSECKTAGYDPGEKELRYLCTLEAADRAAHIVEAKERTKGSGTRPTGTSRRPGAGSAGAAPVKESKPQKAPAIPKWDDL